MKKIKYNTVTNAGNLKVGTGKLFEVDDFQFAIDKNNTVTELSTGARVFEEVHNMNMITYTEEQVIEKVKLKISDKDRTDTAIYRCRKILELMEIPFPVNERF